MKIIQLEYFSAVCRYHSITQAAQKLYVTQPAISNAIRELEKEFSISLFSRTKNHMVLTKEGEEFYQKASVLLNNIHETTSELYDLGKQITPIRIGIPPLLSTVFFPDMLTAFYKKYPNIPVELFEYGSVRAAADWHQIMAAVSSNIVVSMLMGAVYGYFLDYCRRLFKVSRYQQVKA